MGAEAPAGITVPPGPTLTAPPVAQLSWQVNVLKMRLNSVATANDVNTKRLEVCHDFAPNGAAVIVPAG